MYWVNNVGKMSTVMKAPLPGGPPATLASGQSGPYGIAVAATGVDLDGWRSGDEGCTDGRNTRHPRPGEMAQPASLSMTLASTGDNSGGTGDEGRVGRRHSSHPLRRQRSIWHRRRCHQRLLDEPRQRHGDEGRADGRLCCHCRPRVRASLPALPLMPPTCTGSRPSAEPL